MVQLHLQLKVAVREQWSGWPYGNPQSSVADNRIAGAAKALDCAASIIGVGS
jgi:hypothetical protein